MGMYTTLAIRKMGRQLDWYAFAFGLLFSPFVYLLMHITHLSSDGPIVVGDLPQEAGAAAVVRVGELPSTEYAPVTTTTTIEYAR